MTMRRTKRYTVQSFKKNEKIEDPYAIHRSPEGIGICPDCHAIYHHKRWSFPTPSREMTISKSAHLVERGERP
jgi:hypothetical protein